MVQFCELLFEADCELDPAPPRRRDVTIELVATDSPGRDSREMGDLPLAERAGNTSQPHAHTWRDPADNENIAGNHVTSDFRRVSRQPTAC